MAEGTIALAKNGQKTQAGNEDKIFSILFDQDEITWQTMIYELIKTEQMDPWDVDVSIIAERFIEMLKEMKKMDFRISGKIIVAAAFFLKIKSDKLLNEDIVFLDNLINPNTSPEELMDMLEESSLGGHSRDMGRPTLELKTPQPRRRKVSVYDLISALERAMAFEQKRTFFRLPAKTKLRIPDKQKPITTIINEVFERIKKALKDASKVTFDEISLSERREDRIMTFVPLLYLDTQRKIDVNQSSHFGEITINLAKAKPSAEPN